MQNASASVSLADHSMQTTDIPWQYAVYTRPKKTDTHYSFSHVGHTSLQKSFHSTLSVPALLAHPQLTSDNRKTILSAPLLVLVTGKWAQHISIESYASYNKNMDKAPSIQYDHLQRLLPSSPPCAELSKDYHCLKFHSTMAHYERSDADHVWHFASSIPFLSDTVIIPRAISSKHLKTLMFGFHRMTRKVLRDSILVAAGTRYKEETLACVKRDETARGLNDTTTA